PNRTELDNMFGGVRFSDGRPFIVSDEKNAAGKYVGSFLSYDHVGSDTPPWRIPYMQGGFYKIFNAQWMIYFDKNYDCGSSFINHAEMPGRVRCVKKTEVKP
ncbi:MAG: hypothetical protein RR270_06270, partial [Alistipes sp.]